MSGVPFFESYQNSRAWFLAEGDQWRRRWSKVRYQSFPVDEEQDLWVDACWLEPRDRQKLVVISTGEHGIEGYVGASMLRLFSHEFLPRLDPDTTGVLFIHAINPWGMLHHRKVNENGVDLNRNFILDGNFDPAFNPDFARNQDLYSPARPLGLLEWEYAAILIKIARAVVQQGVASLSRASLLGQYSHPQAMFYGGKQLQPQAQIVLNLAGEALRSYPHVVVMDQHTGYGPRYQMSITVLPDEPLNSEELRRKFAYPLVQKVNPEEFYQINGDMTAGMASLQADPAAGKLDFICAFEFGTYGESLVARIRSLITMIFESQNYAFPSRSARTDRFVRRWFKELYFPEELKWRSKALVDAKQAFEGILNAYGYL
ncbi:MAG TPA: M14 family metallopeptidase [Anaerolineales bacterium]|nr:M14 family metallopeptidase [Anaerolineales bacterium]